MIKKWRFQFHHILPWLPRSPVSVESFPSQPSSSIPLHVDVYNLSAKNDVKIDVIPLAYTAIKRTQLDFTWFYILRIANCELRVASCELQKLRYELNLIYELQFYLTSCTFILRVALLSCKLHV